MTVSKFSFQRPARAKAVQWLRVGSPGSVWFIGLKVAEWQQRQRKHLAQLCLPQPWHVFHDRFLANATCARQ
jgi:hypothetical protein